MVKILCVWEQGSKLGHLSNLRTSIEIAVAQGHEVFVAARELHDVLRVFDGLPLRYLAAPFRQVHTTADQSPLPSFSHLLARQCFSGVNELAVYLNAWRTLFDLVNPQLVLFEHSPTALIAAHAYEFKKVLVGNGFSVPPAPTDRAAPFLPFPTTPATVDVWSGLLQDDAEVLKLINRALDQVGTPRLESLHEIYAQVDDAFLTTWPLLDHFGAREGARYFGVQPAPPKRTVAWPHAPGPKVFGYLEAIPSLERLLLNLREARAVALLFVRNLPPALETAYAGDRITFLHELVDLSHVAREADWVVSNGNHITVAHFLAAGVPQLIIPLYQEHLFLGLNLARRGVALVAFQDQPDFSQEVSALTSDPSFKQTARQIAPQCAPYDPQRVEREIQEVFSELLGNPL